MSADIGADGIVLRRRLRAPLASGLILASTGALWAAGASPPPISALPTEFAGEVITVALAFSLPALVAGAYLIVQGLKARLGTRTLVAGTLATAVVGTLVFIAPEAGTGVLQWAGLMAPPR